MRTRKLLRLAKGFSILFIIAGLLTIIHQWTYSNVPLFTQYLIKTLLGHPGIADGNIVVGEVHLPGFLIAFFERSTDIMEIVMRIAISLLILRCSDFIKIY
jgi:ATP-binding cassette subfamily B protein